MNRHKNLNDKLAQQEMISAKGKIWKIKEFDERQSITLQQKLNLPELVSRILAGKNISHEQAVQFLNPTLRELLPNPFHLLDMDKAANSIAESIINKENIVVYGDYDVDGATSSALLTRFFKMVKHENISVYIPDRMKEGYGPNSQAMRKLREEGVDLIITVDCGTMSYEPLKVAKEVGLKVVVIDHHIGGENLPEALAVVNPNRADEISEYKYLAAVGVSFLVAVAVGKILREQGYFIDRSEPDLLSLLDLVALGTICDIVPLEGINRAFVRQGLKILAKRANKGLAALCDIAALNQEIEVRHLGFAIGPRINAGGRVGKSDLGSLLLAEDDYDKGFAIAKQLDHHNNERKAIETLVLDEAMLKAANFDNLPLIFIAGNDWHPGVVGIVASRIKDKYNKPTAVISLSGGMAKASCRSVKGVDFGGAIVLARSEGLILEGGGHAMAAGFTTKETDLAVLQDFLCDRFLQELELGNQQNISHFEGHLTIKSINLDLVESINSMSPFGPGNNEPRFMLKNCSIIKATIVGHNHVSCIIGDADLGGFLSGTLKGIAMNAVGTKLAELLTSRERPKIDLIVTLSVNSWQGRKKAEVVILDAIKLS